MVAKEARMRSVGSLPTSLIALSPSDDLTKLIRCLKGAATPKGVSTSHARRLMVASMGDVEHCVHVMIHRNAWLLSLDGKPSRGLSSYGTTPSCGS